MTTMQDRIADLTPPRGIEAITAVTDGYKAYQALCTAIDVGLFPWLAANGPADRKTIVAALSMKGMYLGSFLQTLVDARLLDLDGDRYGLAAASRACLIPGERWYQGEAAAALKGPHSPWSALTALMCETPVEPLAPGVEAVARLRARHPVWGEAQAVAHSLAARPDFLMAESLMDLGGSCGLFSIALCQINPNLTASVLASPADLPLATALVAEYGMSDRISVRVGHPLDSDLGMGHDIVLAAHTLYGVRQEVAAIFHRAAAALQTGGLLVSSHWFCREGCEPSPGGVRDMDKCVTAGGHPLCHIERFGGLMREAGFANLTQLDIHGLYGLGKLHIATRQSAPAALAKGASRGCGC